MRTKSIRKVYISILLIALVVLFPFYMGLPQQSLDRSLILAFGIDKTENEYEVSVQVMVPESSQSGYKENRQVKSNKGATIDEAIAKLQLQEGKKIAVAHANILIIGEQAIGDNINQILDYFVRNRDIGYMAIATTPDKAKDLLETSSKSMGDKDSLLRLVNYNNEYIFGTESTMNKILSGYYSPSQTSLISRLSIIDLSQNSEDSQSGSQSSLQQSSQSGESGSNKQTEKKEIKNDGSLTILKKGKLVTTLSALEYRGFHWLMPIVYSSFIKLENVSDENLNNATVVLDIFNSKDNIEYKLNDNNKLNINFETTLEYRISSVEQENYIVDNYAEFMKNNTETIRKAMQTLINKEINKALEISKEYQVDVWNVYDKFYQKYNKKFTKLVENNEGDYLRDLQVFVKVNVKENKI